MKKILLLILLQSLIYSNVLEIKLKDFVSVIAQKYNKTILIDKELNKDITLIASKDLNSYQSFAMIIDLLDDNDLTILQRTGYYYITNLQTHSKILSISNLNLQALQTLSKIYDIEVSYLQEDKYIVTYTRSSDYKKFNEITNKMQHSKTLKIEGEIYNINHNYLKDRGLNIDLLIDTINNFNPARSANIEFFNQIGFTYANDNLSLNGYLKFLNQEGFINVITRPNFITLSGKEAVFYNGFDFREPQSQTSTLESDNPVTQVTYKDVSTGLKIKIKPTYIQNDVNIELSFEDSSIDTKDDNNNFIKQNTTFTASFQIPTNQFVTLAGLTTTKEEFIKKSVPMISKIPFFGNAFKSNTDTTNQTTYILNLKVQILDLKPFERGNDD